MNRYDQSGAVPPVVLEGTRGIIRALAEQAARRRRVFEMSRFLEMEKQLFETGGLWGHHDARTR
jgi:hypothetical protein